MSWWSCAFSLRCCGARKGPRCRDGLRALGRAAQTGEEAHERLRVVLFPFVHAFSQPVCECSADGVEPLAALAGDAQPVAAPVGGVRQALDEAELDEVSGL